VNAWRFDPANDVSLSEMVKTWINVDKPSLGSMSIKHDVGATKEEAIARTQLAATAPDLLAALEESLDYFRRMKYDDGADGFDGVIATCEAAIAKAGGA
jgi:hypothetical protein